MQNVAIDTAMKTAKSTSGDGHSRVTVWLVEDNETFRNTVSRALARVPTIDCARRFPNAEEALAALEGGAVANVILLDIELPGINGVEAVKRIKSLSPATKIIMFTVVDSDDKIFNAICAGASGYLLKTSSAQKITEAIHEVHSGGAPMTPKVARAVLDMFARVPQPTQDYGLTEREREILELTVEGLIKKEIADKLSLSYHTVDTHLRNIYTKLHVHTRTGAEAKALF
jgi:DNA-binding NarL/FixJ family response regulator